MDTCVIEYNGKEYEIKYTFDFMRKLKSRGCDIPKLFVKLTEGGSDKLGGASLALIDDIVEALSIVLRISGATDATPEQVHKYAISNGRTGLHTATGFILWVGGQHFNIGENVKAEEEAEKKQ